jgi:hypothetical protein
LYNVCLTYLIISRRSASSTDIIFITDIFLLINVHVFDEIYFGILNLLHVGNDVFGSHMIIHFPFVSGLGSNLYMIYSWIMKNWF